MEPSTLLDLAGERTESTRCCSDDEAHHTLDEQEILDDINLDDLEEALREAQQEDAMKPPALRRGGANTGAKGVLADYAEAKERAKLRRQAQAEAHYLQMRDKAITIKPSTGREEEEDDNDSDDDKRQKEVQLHFEEGRLLAWQLDPDDEDFIRLYREKRMQELQASQRRTFGHLKSITAYEFSDEIDNEAESGAFVVIHLFKNYLAPCVRMNHVLQKLAQKFSYVKFLKIVSTEAEADYSDAALPTLLVYKNGNLCKSLIRVTDELPSGWDQDDTEALLGRHGIVPVVKAAVTSKPIVQSWNQ